MRVLPYIVSTSLLLTATHLYAAYPAGYQTDFSVSVCITSPSGSCDDIQSPVVVYNGTWAGPFGGTITFTEFPNGAIPGEQLYPVTLGTIDDPNIGVPSPITIKASSTDETTIGPTKYFAMENTESPATPLPYTVYYQACSGLPTALTPDTEVVFAASRVSFISDEPGVSTATCHPQDGGTAGEGAGQLSFVVVNPNNTTFGAGSYSGTLTLTVCTQGTVCT